MAAVWLSLWLYGNFGMIGLIGIGVNEVIRGFGCLASRSRKRVWAIARLCRRSLFPPRDITVIASDTDIAGFTPPLSRSNAILILWQLQGLCGLGGNISYFLISYLCVFVIARRKSFIGYWSTLTVGVK